jgi:hypothetical protein
MLRKTVLNKNANWKFFSTFTGNTNTTDEELRQRLLLMSSKDIVQRKGTQDCGPVAIAQLINWVTPIQFPFVKFLDVSQFLFKKKWLGYGEMVGENELPGFALAFSKVITVSRPLVRVDSKETSLYQILFRFDRCQVACVVGGHFIVVHYDKSYGEGIIFVSGLWDKSDENVYTEPKKMTIAGLYQFLQKSGLEPRVLSVFVPQN